MASGHTAGTLGAVGKWFTALLTTSAAIVALMVNAQNLGLTSWIGATELGFAGYAVRRILVTPRADSLLSIGDTAVLAATVTDRRGAVLVGVPLVWSSEDSTVATVDSAGAVIARGPGLTRIVAEVREHRASATVLVRPQVARVEIGGDSTLSLPEVDSVRLTAIPFDARSFRVRGAVVSWSSTDTFAVTVDSLGRVRSRAPGRALIVASSGGRQGNVSVDVHLTPFRLRVLSGDGQHAPAGRMLPEAVTLEVLSRSGQPVPSAEVLLSASQGELDREKSRTDPRGRLQATWTLGARPGRQSFKARLAGSDSSVTISAESDPVASMVRIELADTSPTGTAGAALNPPVILKLTDADGAPLSDVPVGWSVSDGGTVMALAPRTDSLGQAIGRWTLGPKAGRQRLRIQVGDARSLSPFTLSATARAGVPATMTVTSGAGQRVQALKSGKPITVQVRDSLNNPVPGAKLIASRRTGLDTDSVFTTDASGQARVPWTAGSTAGNAALVLVSADSKASTTISIQVTAAPAKPVVTKALKSKQPPAKPASRKPAPRR